MWRAPGQGQQAQCSLDPSPKQNTGQTECTPAVTSTHPSPCLGPAGCDAVPTVVPGDWPQRSGASQALLQPCMGGSYI